MALRMCRISSTSLTCRPMWSKRGTMPWLAGGPREVVRCRCRHVAVTIVGSHHRGRWFCGSMVPSRSMLAVFTASTGVRLPHSAQPARRCARTGVRGARPGARRPSGPAVALVTIAARALGRRPSVRRRRPTAPDQRSSRCPDSQNAGTVPLMSGTCAARRTARSGSTMSTLEMRRRKGLRGQLDVTLLDTRSA